AVDRNRSAVRRGNAGDDVHERGLPAAGRAGYRAYLARGEKKVYYGQVVLSDAGNPVLFPVFFYAQDHAALRRYKNLRGTSYMPGPHIQEDFTRRRRPIFLFT